MKQPTKTVHIRVRTLDDVANLLDDIVRGYKGIFVQKTAESLVGYLKISDPEYKYVSRKSAYPEAASDPRWGGKPGKPGYFSPAQFRLVMAKIAKGEITPGVSQRTGATINGWQVKGANPGLATIVNTAPGITWTMNDHWQARQPAKVGWQKTSVVIQQNIDDAMVDGIDAVLDAMQQKGL